jgi:hypothetical protein
MGTENRLLFYLLKKEKQKEGQILADQPRDFIHQS